MHSSVSYALQEHVSGRTTNVFSEGIASQAILPERLLPYCLDILRKFSSSERDLIRVVVEVIHDLRDTDKEDEEEGVCFLLVFYAH